MTPCIEWQGCRLRDGYGHRRHNGKMVMVHRWAWEQANGPIPTGLCVLHRCDNPPCYNVDHLFLGTKLDNSRDMVAKGRERGRREPPGEDHHNARLAWPAVEEIRRRYRSDQISQRELGLEYGISRTHVSAIVTYRKWKVKEAPAGGELDT